MDVVTLLTASDIFRFYHRGDEEIRALKGVNLTVKAGEIVALTGPSGGGKSTLLSCITGLDEPDGGTVDIEGRRMSRRPEALKSSIRRSSLGLMAQRDNLFSHLTVAENVELVHWHKGAVDASHVSGILQKVDLLHRANAYPATLSGGERARAGLAVALACDAPLLIADEPTAEVDVGTEETILHLLVKRRDEGRGALIATHSPGVEAIASRVLHLVDGHLTEIKSRSKIASPSSGGVVRQNHEVLAVDDAELRSGAPIIVCEGLGRIFGNGRSRLEAVRPTTFSVHPRDRISIMGPSGSGKSTLISLLAGLVAPSSGTISWFGESWKDGLRPDRIAVVPQDPSLLPSLTVIENVHVPLLLGRPKDRNVVLSAHEALGLLSLSDLADKLPDELSGGQIQRVAFARALVTLPDIIFADEPTGQLDRSTGQSLMSNVLEAIQDHPTALVVTTHDPVLSSRMTTRWRMEHGHLDTGSMRERRC